MSISFYNFNELHNQEFKEIVKKKISDIIDQGAFVEGEYNTLFEEEFKKIQNSNHCLLVGNGTDALEIALRALGIGHGDTVGVPAITFYATAEAVLNIGAEVVFIDVDEETGLMDVKSLERVQKIHSLKALIPVHIYGLPAPMEEIEKICSKNNIKIVEDAAQAQGTLVNGHPVGSGKNLVTFSFYPTKNLSAFGDAGCILTQDDLLAKKIKGIRNHGREIEGLGRNSRCDHIQAAVLQTKLCKIDQYNKNRKGIASLYHDLLKDFDKIKLLPEKYLESSSWHLYPIKLESSKERIRLQGILKEKEIGSAPFYEEAISEMNELHHFEGEDEIAKNFAGKILCLPIHPFLNQKHVEEVVEAVKLL